MERNIGHSDKTIRIVAGLFLFSLMFILPGYWKLIGLIGLVPLGTAIIGYCPAYTLFGTDTCENKHTSQT